MAHFSDTIVAIATAAGQAGVGIVRLSGAEAKTIAERICGELTQPRHAYYREFTVDKHILDQGIAIHFEAPHSYTGEHVVELQAHGGDVLMQMLCQACVAEGARYAEPGEFSKRAYLNDKMDLLQAESVIAVIEASSEQAALSAARSLSGKFSEAINALLEQLVYCRTYVEAHLDFPDEDIDLLQDKQAHSMLEQLNQQTDIIFQRAQQGAILNHGTTIVIAGKPNVGKSSLLNCLAGEDKAIVTHIEGTTRDLVSSTIHIQGVPVHIVDTAGLRVTDDEVEQMGIAKSIAEIGKADLVLALSSVDDPELPAEVAHIEGIPVLPVVNKIDINETTHEAGFDGEVLYISAKHGLGIDALAQRILDNIGYQASAQQENSYIARSRHINALQQTQTALANAMALFTTGQQSELVAEELRIAQESLASITGEFTPDDLLTSIFSSFCIGK